MYKPAVQSRKVAVMGGGPAGMKAALTAVERGHQVSLFEKSGKLGGQLLHTDYSSFKWPLRDYKDYLIRKLEASGADIRLNTAPSPEDIVSEGFDALLYAVGAEPKRPNIPGIDGDHVRTALDVYGHEQELGHRVVVIGGSETGVETAAYLSMCGHKVTVLTRGRMLAHDSQPVHYREMFEELWKELEDFDYYVKVTTTSIENDRVSFTDSEGLKQSIYANDVVVCGGMAPRMADAPAYSDVVKYFRIIGDCKRVGDVRTATKAAYVAAMLID